MQRFLGVALLCCSILAPAVASAEDESIVNYDGKEIYYGGHHHQKHHAPIRPVHMMGHEKQTGSRMLNEKKPKDDKAEKADDKKSDEDKDEKADDDKDEKAGDDKAEEKKQAEQMKKAQEKKKKAEEKKKKAAKKAYKEKADKAKENALKGMSETNGAPSQGFRGKIVEHEDGKTQTEDFGSEYGHADKSWHEICKENKKNVWCKYHLRKTATRSGAAMPTAFGSVLIALASSAFMLA